MLSTELFYDLPYSIVPQILSIFIGFSQEIFHTFCFMPVLVNISSLYRMYVYTGSIKRENVCAE